MSTLHQSYPTARRTHCCSSCSCSRLIPPGQRYSRWKGTSDMWPGVGTSKECAACCERYGRPMPECGKETQE